MGISRKAERELLREDYITNLISHYQDTDEEVLRVKSNEIAIPVVGLAKDDSHRTRAIVFENGHEIDLKDRRLLFTYCSTVVGHSCSVNVDSMVFEKITLFHCYLRCS